MKPYQKKIIVTLLFIGLIITVRLLGFDKYLSFEIFKNYRLQLVSYVNSNYLTAVLIFLGVYFTAVALSIPGATILTLSGGFLFGYMAVVYVNIAATTGAILLFIIARYLLGNWIQHRYAARLQRFNAEIESHGHNYLLTLRLIPIFPFFLINLFGGITKTSLFTFFWTTAIGIIPGSFV